MALLLFLASCDSTVDPDLLEPGYAFFPTEPGSYREYAVVEINYRNTGEIDTLRFLLREETGQPDTIAGDVIFPLRRLSRADSTVTWELDSVWSFRRTATQAVQTENNQPFVKLVFPVEEGKTWDGNAFNTRDAEQYEMVNLNQGFNQNSLSFARTVTVIQDDLNDPITGQNLRSEIFAENVGLVTRESSILEFCTDPDCLGQQIIEIGRTYQQRLYAYGVD